MKTIDRAVAARERLAGPASRRAAYYSLAQAAYACLAGSFEMPMAFRLAGRIDLVAFVYAFYFLTLFGGFALGLVLVREGAASLVYRAALGLWSCLSLGAAALFPLMTGLPALVCYFFVRGLAEGLYWSARRRAFLWSVRDAGRDRFAPRLQSLIVSLSVVLPLLGGFAITHLRGGPAAYAARGLSLPAGYVPVFLVTGAAMLLALAFSPSFRIGRSPLSFRAALGVFRLEEARSWRAYVALVSFAGALVSVSAGVQTFGLLKTEFRIGALDAAVAFLSGLSFLVLGRFLAVSAPRAVSAGELYLFRELLILADRLSACANEFARERARPSRRADRGSGVGEGLSAGGLGPRSLPTLIEAARGFRL